MESSYGIKIIAGKLNKFNASPYFGLMLLAAASVFIFTGAEVLGVYILSFIGAVTLLLDKDLLPALESILVICCFAIRCKNSASEFFSLWYLGIPIAVIFFAQFFIQKRKVRLYSFTPGMIAVSIALILGGSGIIYWKSYFSPTSLFYMASLGFGMVILVSYIGPNLRYEDGEKFALRFCRMHTTAILTITVSLLKEYITRFDEFSSKFSALPFQWRNNAATILMMCMPFAFYLASKKYSRILIGILAYIAILFTGSRGGLLFGTVEFAACLLLLLILDKKHRKASIITMAVFAVSAAVTGRFLYDLASYAVTRLFDPDQNSIRLSLIQRGIEDFKANPVFGRGLGYMGNRDIHQSAKHTLCWYHCSPVQVIASAGITGVMAYTYLNIQRIRCFINNISFFSVILFSSFVSLEMMSLVNPGLFAPYPYLMFASVYFAVTESYTAENRETLNNMIKGK